MNYANKYILSRGQECVVERTVSVETRVSIRRNTKASRDVSIRANYWEGLIPLDVGLLGGEVITIKDPNGEDKFLVQSSNYDAQSRMTAFFATKCNVVMEHKRLVEDVDENYNPIQEWKDVNPNKVDIDCYGEIVNQKIRQEVPGLLEGTIYIFQVPKSIGVELLDRVVYNGKKYEVSSIDDVGLSGVDLIQLRLSLR